MPSGASRGVKAGSGGSVSMPLHAQLGKAIPRVGANVHKHRGAISDFQMRQLCDTTLHTLPLGSPHLSGPNMMV